jgi:hypothetical protein
MKYRSILGAAFLAAFVTLTVEDQTEARFARARENGKRFEEALAASPRVPKVCLTHADKRTLLLPDRIPGSAQGLKADDPRRLCTPHNSGADLYPYLILTAQITDPDLYRGRLMEMLRHEVRFTTVQEFIPASLEMTTGELGPPSLFGAGSASAARDMFNYSPKISTEPACFQTGCGHSIDESRNAPETVDLFVGLLSGRVRSVGLSWLQRLPGPKDLSVIWAAGWRTTQPAHSLGSWEYRTAKKRRPNPNSGTLIIWLPIHWRDFIPEFA